MTEQTNRTRLPSLVADLRLLVYLFVFISFWRFLTYKDKD